MMHADNQAFKEECAMTENNNLFGKFHLAGIMPEKRGLPQVEITFDIDTFERVCLGRVICFRTRCERTQTHPVFFNTSD